MERPVSFSSEDIRDEKVSNRPTWHADNQVKVLRAIPPIKKEEVLLGQYAATGDKPGYLDDESVPKGSKCPTFASMILHVNNDRWQGVPFIMKAGKGERLPTMHESNAHIQH
jgi:glucose-6-phosphate 1-dehydrogenase